MTPSLTLDYPMGLPDAMPLRMVHSVALTYPDELTTVVRSRRALLAHAADGLHDLAIRQDAQREEPYVVVLGLIEALIGTGSATPQVADNGDGGIEVTWLVNGASLTIDYEDEFEILLTGVNADGRRAFAHTLTAYWTRNDSTVVEARRFLAELSKDLAHPLPLS